jgi:hypothetical protein
MAVYPTALVTTTDIPNAGANLSTNPHSSLHDESRDELVAIEAELGIAPSGSYSTVKARLDAGWQPIAANTVSAVASFTITIPASTYRWLRIEMTLDTSSAPTTLRARVNNDSTAALHRYLLTAIDGTSAIGREGPSDSTSWRIGSLSNLHGKCTLMIANADASSLLPWHSTGGAYSATAGSASNFQANGFLSAARSISSLVILPGAGTMTGDWIAEGYVP